MPQKLVAELLGTAFLLATVIGSGIMAENLAGGNVAIALLGNTIATGAILVVLIMIFGQISGAHFNPAVSIAFWLRKELPASHLVLFVCAQITGGLMGMIAAHYMFELPIDQISEKSRAGLPQMFSEVVATFGLVAAILGTLKWKPEAVAYAVGLYITAAYWFTASTSFANPAVTIARSYTNTFSGIAPADMPGFIIAQIIGAVLAVFVFMWLLSNSENDG